MDRCGEGASGCGPGVYAGGMIKQIADEIARKGGHGSERRFV